MYVAGKFTNKNLLEVIIITHKISASNAESDNGLIFSQFSVKHNSVFQINEN